MKNYHLTISTPDGNVFDGSATMLTLRGIEGDLAILAGHIPFITAVKPCDIAIITDEENEKTAHIEGGILTVASDKTTLLSSGFEWK